MVVCAFTVCSGCGTFLGHSDKFDVDVLNSRIDRYEKDGIEQEPYELYPIGYTYKCRAYCYAHHLPKYQYTRRCLVLSSYLFTKDISMPERGFGLIGVIDLPIGFVIDTINYPIQFIRTQSVSDADIKQALLDLEKARELGFNGRIFPAPMLVNDFDRSLEMLGYSLEQYKEK